MEEIDKEALRQFRSARKGCRPKNKAHNCYRYKDYHRHYKTMIPKDKPEYNMNREKFRVIMNRMLMLQREYILQGGVLKLPYGIGNIRIIKVDLTPEIKNGRLINRKIINWGATTELWFKDEEARKNKVFMYFDNNDTHTIYLCKAYRSNLKFKLFAMFHAATSFKYALSAAIKDGMEYPLNKHSYDRQARIY